MEGVANGRGGAVAGRGRGWMGRGGGRGRVDPAPRGASRNGVILCIRARAQTPSAFRVREVLRVRRSVNRVLWAKMTTGTALFGVVKMQAVQESCTGRSRSAWQAYRAGSPSGLGRTLGHAAATCSPGR